MRDSIKATLQSWMGQLEAQKDTQPGYGDYEFLLDYKVLGAATFVKQVAYLQDDLELLAIATKVEMKVEQILKEEEDAEEEEERESYEIRQQAYVIDEQIREICIRHFYTEPAFSVDMSKYKLMVEASSENFSDPYKLASLRRYVDEEEVLNKIFDRVKSRLRRTTLYESAPTFDEVSRAFEAELQKVYRLAESYVDRMITQHAKASVYNG